MDVKQVFGLECGRSALTGVGFIRLDGFDDLKDKQKSDFKINNINVLFVV